MRADKQITWAFLAAAGLQVTGLFLDQQLIPYAGALAIVSLTSLAWIRPSDGSPWFRRLTVAGLAALAAATALVEARTGGSAWLDDATGGRGGEGLAEVLLLAGSVSALAAAVLGRAGKLIRVRHVPAVVFALPALAVVGSAILPADAPADPALLGAVLTVPMLAIALVALGVNAALLHRGALRLAGVAMVPLLVLTLSLPAAAIDTGVAEPQQYSVWELPEGCADFAYRARQDALISEVESRRDRQSWGSAVMPVRIDPDALRSEVEFTGRDARAATIAAPVSGPDLAVVSGPPSWSGSLWYETIDWDRSRPALLAALLLLTLAALTTALFPRTRGPELDGRAFGAP